MPIRSDMLARYPANWEEISLAHREASGWKCEWCGAADGQPHPVTGSIVVLAVAHILNPDPADVRDENLAALCARCHLNHDQPQHLATYRANKRKAMNTPDIFEKDNEA